MKCEATFHRVVVKVQRKRVDIDAADEKQCRVAADRLIDLIKHRDDGWEETEYEVEIDDCFLHELKQRVEN